MGEDDDLLKRFATLKSKAFAVASTSPVDKPPAADVAALDHTSISDDEVNDYLARFDTGDEVLFKGTKDETLPSPPVGISLKRDVRSVLGEAWLWTDDSQDSLRENEGEEEPEGEEEDELNENVVLAKALDAAALDGEADEPDQAEGEKTPLAAPVVEDADFSARLASLSSPSTPPSITPASNENAAFTSAFDRLASLGPSLVPPISKPKATAPSLEKAPAPGQPPMKEFIIPGFSKDLDNDPDHWCCICNQDAQWKCAGCDEDLYCGECFKQGHEGESLEEMRRHRPQRWTSKLKG